MFRKKNGAWNFSGTDYFAFWWHYLLYFVPCVQMLVVWMSFAELGMAWMLMTWLVGFPGFSAVPMLMPCQVRVHLVPRISPLVRRAKKAKATSASCTRIYCSGSVEERRGAECSKGFGRGPFKLQTPLPATLMCTMSQTDSGSQSKAGHEIYGGNTHGQRAGLCHSKMCPLRPILPLPHAAPCPPLALPLHPSPLLPGAINVSLRRAH